MKQTDHITRQSIIILISQLIILETIVSILGYIIKFPLINGWFDNIIVYTLITILIQGFNIASIILILMRWVNTEYRIENGSLIIKKGILSIREKTYALDNVETVEIEQNWIARILGFGTINVYSPLFQEHVSLWSIPHTHKFADDMKQFIPTGSRVTVAPKR